MSTNQSSKEKGKATVTSDTDRKETRLCFSSRRVNEAKREYSHVLRWLHSGLGREVMVGRDKAFHTAQLQQQETLLPEPGTLLCVSIRAAAGRNMFSPSSGTPSVVKYTPKYLL